MQKSIREAAKRGDMGSARVSRRGLLCTLLTPLPAALSSGAHAQCAVPLQHLAKEVLASRKAVSRLYINKAHMQSLSTALTEQLGEIRRVLCSTG